MEFLPVSILMLWCVLEKKTIKFFFYRIASTCIKKNFFFIKTRTLLSLVSPHGWNFFQMCFESSSSFYWHVLMLIWFMHTRLCPIYGNYIVCNNNKVIYIIIHRNRVNYLISLRYRMYNWTWELRIFRSLK